MASGATRRALRLCLTLAFLVAVRSSFAGFAASDFNVTAGVAPRCTIAISDMAFGVYDPLRANARAALDATATLSLVCTRGTMGAVSVDAGRHGGGDEGERQMSSGSQRLAYQIFRDPSRTAVWEAGVEGTTFVAGGGPLAPDRIRLFGRVPPNQMVLSGQYVDTITATVQF